MHRIGHVNEEDSFPSENLGPEGPRGHSCGLGPEDVRPWATDGTGGGGTRKHYDNPGVGPLGPSHLWSAQLLLGAEHTQQAEPVHLLLAGRIPPGQVCSEIPLK